MFKRTLLALTTLSAVAIAQESNIEWDYTNHGNDWEGVCQTGEHQSPVEIPNLKWRPRLPVFWRGYPTYENSDAAEVGYGPKFLTVQYNGQDDSFSFKGSYMHGSNPMNETY